MSQVTLNKFSGLNNVARPERARKGDLQSAYNVDIDDVGRIRLRRGSRRVYAGNVHSVMRLENDIIFRENSDLKLLNLSDGTASILKSGFSSSNQLAHIVLDGRLYFSDGETSGIYENGTCRSWGLQPPPMPVVVNDMGDLVAGKYQVACTYIRNDGQESGSSVAAFVDSTGGLNISVSASGDPTVDGISIYVSTVDGEVLWRQGTMPNADTTVRIGGNLLGEGDALETQFMSPPPAGTIIKFYRGRIYIASGNVYWYTNPWQYELVSEETNFGVLGKEITMFEPVEGGIWVGTYDEAFFLAGSDPESTDGGLQIRSKTKLGAIHGTSQMVDELTFVELNHGPCVVWLSEGGIIAGDGMGQWRNMTSDYFLPPECVGGSSGTTYFDGITQYLFAVKQEASGSGSANIVVRNDN